MNITLLLIFPMLLVIAGFFDLFTMTIPNWVSGLIAVSFFVLAFALGMPLSQIGISLLVATGILLLSMGMFALGWFGGGDAKLLTASALWMGATNMPAFVLGICLVGGAVTLSIIGFRQLALPKKLIEIHWIARHHDNKEGVPYGIAIAVMGVLLFSNTSLFEILSS